MHRQDIDEQGETSTRDRSKKRQRGVFKKCAIRRRNDDGKARLVKGSKLAKKQPKNDVTRINPLPLF